MNWSACSSWTASVTMLPAAQRGNHPALRSTHGTSGLFDKGSTVKTEAPLLSVDQDDSNWTSLDTPDVFESLEYNGSVCAAGSVYEGGSGDFSDLENNLSLGDESDFTEVFTDLSEYLMGETSTDLATIGGEDISILSCSAEVSTVTPTASEAVDWESSVNPSISGDDGFSVVSPTTLAILDWESAVHPTASEPIGVPTFSPTALTTCDWGSTVDPTALATVDWGTTGYEKDSEAVSVVKIQPTYHDHSDYVTKAKKVKRTNSIASSATDFDGDRSEVGDRDAKYLERRRKNNIASRRSRETRKNKLSLMEEEAIHLEKSNAELIKKVAELEKATKAMKAALVAKLAGK